MTRSTLPAEWIDRLARLPESGMGWQRVDVELSGGRRLENCLVRNAEILESPEPPSRRDVASARQHSRGLTSGARYFAAMRGACNAMTGTSSTESAAASRISRSAGGKADNSGASNQTKLFKHTVTGNSPR